MLEIKYPIYKVTRISGNYGEGDNGAGNPQKEHYVLAQTDLGAHRAYSQESVAASGSEIRIVACSGSLIVDGDLELLLYLQESIEKHISEIERSSKNSGGKKVGRHKPSSVEL